MGQIQARGIKAFSSMRKHQAGVFRSDALVYPKAHFTPKTPLFSSLSPFRSDYPLPRPIAKKILKINGLRNSAILSEKRMFGVAGETGTKRQACNVPIILEKSTSGITHYRRFHHEKH